MIQAALNRAKKKFPKVIGHRRLSLLTHPQCCNTSKHEIFPRVVWEITKSERDLLIEVQSLSNRN